MKGDWFGTLMQFLKIQYAWKWMIWYRIPIKFAIDGHKKKIIYWSSHGKLFSFLNLKFFIVHNCSPSKFQNIWCIFKRGSCNFSWFYKIPHLLKWLNLPFIIYLILYWCYQPQNCFGTTKVYLLWQTKFVFYGKPKMTKKFEFEKLKIPNPDIWPFWEFFNFSNSIFFCHFWFPIEKNIFFSK